MSNQVVNVASNNPLASFLYTLFCIATAVIGKAIHGSTFWAIVDFFFAPFAWLKWFILKQVNITIIQEAFSWFMQ